MPRRLRITPGGLVYHVLNRDNARDEIFHDSADYAAFERILAEGLGRLPLDLFAYMTPVAQNWRWCSQYQDWLEMWRENYWRALEQTAGNRPTDRAIASGTACSRCKGDRMPKRLVLALIMCFLVGCGKAKPSAAPPNYNAIAQKGAPLVQAIYKYKYENGLWPQTLSALVPNYATAAQVQGSRYVWRWDGEWKLENYQNFPTARVQYMACEGHTGWYADFGEIDNELDFKQPPPATQPIDPAEVTRRAAADIRRRIAADPEEMEHLRGLVCLYIRASDYAQARAALADFAKRYPKHIWGPWALSYVDAREGKIDAGEERLRALAAADPDLATSYVLFDYYRAASMRDKALQAVRSTLALAKYPEVVENAHVTGILYDMARFAYAAGD